MKKRIIIAVCALLVIALLFVFFTALVMPKYTDSKQIEGRLIGEYYEEAGGHDVLFVGDCEVYESFVPAILWEKYGISSYVRGSPQQLVWQSYYLLEEMFKYENPKAVVFNVLALKYGEPRDEAMNRMTLDGMKWSSSKRKAIRASMTEGEKLADYMIPILRYHSRITELTWDDFKYVFKKPDRVSDSGYLMNVGVKPTPEYYIGMAGDPLYDYTLPARAMEYLDMMKNLCREKGCELVLVKAPTNSVMYYWYDEWDEQICDYAEKNGLAYYNLIDECDNIGIDWNTDTYDMGAHLNVYGAEKTSAYFGKILSVNHGIADRRGESDIAAKWQERLNAYYARKKEMESKQ
ncbi:MAG: SGNH/GDSL hydrolase family protein [Ruminococcaceae bacterium]|nr:SGNH/GDSL hydrolase family protein [Oscillospiraceae bacterium]